MCTGRRRDEHPSSIHHIPLLFSARTGGAQRQAHHARFAARPRGVRQVPAGAHRDQQRYFENLLDIIEVRSFFTCPSCSVLTWSVPLFHFSFFLLSEDREHHIDAHTSFSFFLFFSHHTHAGTRRTCSMTARRRRGNHLRIRSVKRTGLRTR